MKNKRLKQAVTGLISEPLRTQQLITPSVSVIVSSHEGHDRLEMSVSAGRFEYDAHEALALASMLIAHAERLTTREAA